MAKKKSPRKILRSVLRLVRFFRPQIVREKRLLVGRLDLARGGCDCRRSITIVARYRTWLLHSASKLSDDVGRGELSLRARVPLRSCGGEPLLGRPSVRRDDSHCVGEADNLAHPRHCHRLCLIHEEEQTHEPRIICSLGLAGTPGGS